MQVTEPPEFDTTARRRIYEYVERQGAVRPSTLYRSVPHVGPGRCKQLVGIMKRDGYLEARNGKLRVGFDGGSTEEFEREDFCFEIRPGRQEDISATLGVIRAVAGAGIDIEAETVAEQLVQEGALIRHNDVESRMFFVATVDSEVIGWCHVASPESRRLRHTAELTLGVLSAYRREGIGSHLLQRGLVWAGANGYEKVHRAVPATNGVANAFLREHGWAVEGRRRDHYRVGGSYVDEVLLAVHL